MVVAGLEWSVTTRAIMMVEAAGDREQRSSSSRAVRSADRGSRRWDASREAAKAVLRQIATGAAGSCDKAAQSGSDGADPRVHGLHSTMATTCSEGSPASVRDELEPKLTIADKQKRRAGASTASRSWAKEKVGAHAPPFPLFSLNKRR